MSSIMSQTVYSHRSKCRRASLFDGMERWNGTMEWNDGMERWNGMEWNDHAYIIVYFRNGHLPRCAHAQQIDLLPAAAYKERL